jgi:hypothetical protein
MFARHHTLQKPHRVRLSGALIALVLVALGVLGAAGSAAAAPKTATIWLGSPLPVVTGTSFSLTGGIGAAANLSGQTVTFAKREMGKNTDTAMGQATVTWTSWGNGSQATLPGLTYSAIVTATWAGNADYLSAAHWIFVPVRAKVTLTAPKVNANVLKLRSTITPSQPQDEPVEMTGLGFLVMFQRKVNGKWTYMGMGGTGSSDGKSWVTGAFYDPRPGTYVLRARFVGTQYNAAAFSKTLNVTVP